LTAQEKRVLPNDLRFRGFSREAVDVQGGNCVVTWTSQGEVKDLNRVKELAAPWLYSDAVDTAT
jgi:hypothetical protein